MKNLKNIINSLTIAISVVLVGLSSQAQAAEVRLVGTGLIVDAANLASAVLAAPSGTKIRLIGNFNLSTCIACIAITKPVIIQGSSCTLLSCTNAIATITGGMSPFYIHQVSGSGIYINHLRFTRQILAAALIAKSTGTVEFNDNKVDTMTPMYSPILGYTRVGLGGAQFILRVFTADPNLRNQYPAIAALGDLPQLLQGNIAFRRNVVDLLTNSPGGDPIIQAEDNGIALGAIKNSRVEISNNTVKTYGDSIQVEGSTVVSAPIYIQNNNVTLKSPLKPEGIIYGWGSPAAIKMQSNANTSATVSGNTVTVTKALNGSTTGTAITAGTTSPGSNWQITNNTFNVTGMQTVIAGGNGGVLPYFLGSAVSGATISGNTFLGSANYGIGFKDVSGLGGSFINDGHLNLIQSNNFDGFTATTGYRVHLGSHTYNNTVKNVPLGNVQNLGTGNIIQP